MPWWTSCWSKKDLPTLVLMFLNQRERKQQMNWESSSMSMMPPSRVENSNLTAKKNYVQFDSQESQETSHRAGFPQKSENKNSMTDLLFSMAPILTWFQIWLIMIVSHNMHDNHKLESCQSHENKQFHDFSMTFWEIFIFQDFSMTFHDSNFFKDFPWPWEPWQCYQYCICDPFNLNKPQWFFICGWTVVLSSIVGYLQ